jgi:hypothetical protein
MFSKFINSNLPPILADQRGAKILWGTSFHNGHRDARLVATDVRSMKLPAFPASDCLARVNLQAKKNNPPTTVEF